MLTIYVDGAARPNPGKGGIGIVIRGDGWDYTISEPLEGKTTNNQAEYKAICRAFNELYMNELESEKITVLSDSELLVEQLNKRREVDKGGKYVEDYSKAKKWLKVFSHTKIEWISREKNDEANLLASRAVGGR